VGELGTGYGMMQANSPVKLNSPVLKEKGIKKVVAGRSHVIVLTGKNVAK
jgi:hypothetical protein